jgi:hypothetical protein
MAVEQSQETRDIPGAIAAEALGSQRHHAFDGVVLLLLGADCHPSPRPRYLPRILAAIIGRRTVLHPDCAQQKSPGARPGLEFGRKAR